MNKTIVTSGNTNTDIDTLACAIAYGEILNKINRPADVYLPGPLNQSVIPEIRSWDLNYIPKLDVQGRKLIIVDVSDTDYMKNCLDLSQVVEIYDHHYGYEKYWQDRLGENSHIEAVGACATLIWEQSLKHKVSLSIVPSNLLYTAIFSNTLNFRSSVTTLRDKKAFAQLSKMVNLPSNWVSVYYETLESETFLDPISAIKHDIKFFNLDKFPQQLNTSQLELWSSKDFCLNTNNQNLIKKILLEKNSPFWFFTSPSISEGINYLYAENTEIKASLTKALNAHFIGNIGTTSKLYLRKEIIKLIK